MEPLRIVGREHVDVEAELDEVLGEPERALNAGPARGGQYIVVSRSFTAPCAKRRAYWAAGVRPASRGRSFRSTGSSAAR